jgi:hypothetical protein
MTLLAASGFAATNIGDSIEARAKDASERTALIAKLEGLRHDRGSIVEMRSPAAIEALIQQEQPHVPPGNWKSSAGCTNVTASGKVCATINSLRQAKANAERRDQLDAEIDATETALRALPAYASADPGADMASRLLTAATVGAIAVSPGTIQQVRRWPDPYSCRLGLSALLSRAHMGLPASGDGRFCSGVHRTSEPQLASLEQPS